jgi:hypothetical protein
VDTTSAIHNVDKSLDDIKHNILQVLFQLHKTTNHDEDHRLLDTTIKESLNSSEAVLSSVSTYFGSTAGTF